MFAWSVKSVGGFVEEVFYYILTIESDLFGLIEHNLKNYVFSAYIKACRYLFKYAG